MKSNQLKARKGTGFGYFVSKINFTSKLLSIITNLLSKIFPSIKKEIGMQNKMQHEINVFVCNINSINLVISSSTKDAKMLLNNYSKLKSIKLGDDKIMNLFGGRDEFEKLPILDIADREGETGYIDFITPKEMTAPIMRGQDKDGREFFSLRFKYKRSETLHCQTFFRRYCNAGSWTDGGKELITTYGHLISHGWMSAENAEPYKKLAELIKNRQLDNAVLI